MGKKHDRPTVIVGMPEYDQGDDLATVTIWDPKWVSIDDPGYSPLYERYQAAEAGLETDAAIRDIVEWYIVDARIPGPQNGGRLPERVINALAKICASALRPTPAATIDSPDTESSAASS